ncbi:hypothetical protein Agub_g15368, partial [Astrephomene gubernaculifera]
KGGRSGSAGGGGGGGVQAPAVAASQPVLQSRGVAAYLARYRQRHQHQQQQQQQHPTRLQQPLQQQPQQQPQPGRRGRLLPAASPRSPPASNQGQQQQQQLDTDNSNNNNSGVGKTGGGGGNSSSPLNPLVWARKASGAVVRRLSGGGSGAAWQGAAALQGPQGRGVFCYFKVTVDKQSHKSRLRWLPAPPDTAGGAAGAVAAIASSFCVPLQPYRFLFALQRPLVNAPVGITLYVTTSARRRGRAVGRLTVPLYELVEQLVAADVRAEAAR